MKELGINLKPIFGVHFDFMNSWISFTFMHRTVCFYNVPFRRDVLTGLLNGRCKMSFLEWEEKTGNEEDG